MSDRLLIATRKGLFLVDRTGDTTWTIGQTAFLGDNVTLGMGDPRDGSLYAALDHGHFGVKLHRSTDAGATWTECTVPEYPKLPVGAEPAISAMTGKPFTSTLKLIWSLCPGGANEPGVLWCGTVPGGLFRSEDRGASWSLMTALWDHPDRLQWFGGGLDDPGIHSIWVDPRDTNHVVVGVSCGGVWITPDGGASWKCQADGMWAAYMPPDRKNDPVIQDPHCVTVCPGNPEVMWAQHHNGVFRTTDGAKTWHEVPNAAPSTFGFAVAAHPTDDKTAWFVPAIKDERRIPVDGKLVVSRTTDGGETFEVLREGLPQTHAYDLVFRHALDVDGTGTRLAFGSTTGGVWFSENAGDNWHELSSHLPPVHAVRFV